MTWVKLEDDFPDHPKVLEVGPMAAWLYVAGLCYCGRFLTDGDIPSVAVPKLIDAPRPNVLVAKLESSGLWERTKTGWFVHDYADHQRTKAQVMADRDAARSRQSRRRSRRDTAVTHAEVTPTEVEVDREVDVEVVQETPASEPGTALALVADDVAPATPRRASYTAEFETWWHEYPRKIEKAPAAKAYQAARRTTSAEHLLTAVRAHAAAWAASGIEANFILYPERWLKRRRYDEAPEVKSAPRAQLSTAQANRERIAASVARLEGRAQ